MQPANALELDPIALNLLRILSDGDMYVDLTAPREVIAVAQALGTTVEGMAQARQRLGQHGFATSEQITNERVRAAITQAGHAHLQAMDAPKRKRTDAPRGPTKEFVWYDPRTWF